MGQKTISRFLEVATAFDNDVQELERLAHQLSEVRFDKESGLLRAQKLMGHFADCGARVGSGVEVLASELDSMRTRAEVAAELVAGRMEEFQSRQAEVQAILARFQRLGESAQSLTLRIADAKKNALAAGGSEPISNYLPEFDLRLATLLNEAEALREAAKISEMKNLEKNADLLSRSLNEAHARLKSM